MRYFVKTYFHGWKEIDKEHFDSWRNTIRSGAVAMTTAEKERHIHKRIIILK